MNYFPFLFLAFSCWLGWVVGKFHREIWETLTFQYWPHSAYDKVGTISCYFVLVFYIGGFVRVFFL